MAAEPDDERRTLEVHRSWSRTDLDTIKFSWEKAGNLSLIPFFVGVMLLFLASPVDGNLWSVQNAPFRLEGIPRLIGPLPALLIAAGLLLSAWGFHRLLSRKTPQDHLVHPLLLVFRFLFSVLPVLGLLVFPLWQLLIRTSSSQVAPRDLAPPRLVLKRSGALHSKLRTTVAIHGWMESKGIIGLSLISHASSMTFLNQWASGLQVTDRTHFFILLALSSVLHLLAFSCGLLHIFLEVRKRYVPLLNLWPFFLGALAWMIPYPVLPFIGVLPLARDFGSTGETLITRSFQKRTAKERLSLGRSLQSSLKGIWGRLPGWRHWARPEARRIEPADSQGAASRLLWLYDLKVTFMISDAAALTWLLLSRLAHDPFQRLLANGCIGAILAGSMLLGFIGLLLNGIRWYQRFLKPSGHRSTLNQHPYGYIFTTAMALFFGLIFGTMIHRLPFDTVKSFFVALALLCSIFQGLAFLFIYIPSLKNLASITIGVYIRRGTLTSLALGITGSFASMASVGLGHWMTGLWLCFSLLSGTTLSLFLLPWLLRPYRLGQILSGKAPVRIRAALLFMLITVLLPGGGWAVPIWITARHRLWPKA